MKHHVHAAGVQGAHADAVQPLLPPSLPNALDGHQTRMSDMQIGIAAALMYMFCK